MASGFRMESTMEATRTRIRARRDGWVTERKFVLTKRDIDILYTLGVCGILRTRDIARFFFGARTTANDRLRKLFCAGLVECFVPDLSSDNYYALTAIGRDRVVEAHGLDPDTLKVVRKLPKKLDHALAITELRLSVSLACRASTTYKLGSFDTDADLARERHAALLDIIPDAKIAITTRASGEVNVFFAELDLGTEAVTWLVKKKLAVYAGHAAIGTSLYGVRDPLVVLVVESLRRARNVARCLAAERVHARVVFALRSMLDENNVLGAAFALPQDLLAAPAETDLSKLFTRRLLP